MAHRPSSKPLEILVLHGYAQSAGIVAQNTQRLKAELADIANLDYVAGPPLHGSSAPGPRPWWILDRSLEYNRNTPERWRQTVEYFSDILSTKQYDGIIGLSQGAAMTAVLVSMIKNPASVPGFQCKLEQPLKFAIMCSGFVSNLEPHASIYASIPADLPTLHTVDMADPIVPPQRTADLQKLFPNSRLLEHSEGHVVPVQGDWPVRMKMFVIESLSK